jgi:hypothetical protein
MLRSIRCLKKGGGTSKDFLPQLDFYNVKILKLRYTLNLHSWLGGGQARQTRFWVGLGCSVAMLPQEMLKSRGSYRFWRRFVLPNYFQTTLVTGNIQCIITLNLHFGSPTLIQLLGAPLAPIVAPARKWVVKIRGLGAIHPGNNFIKYFWCFEWLHFWHVCWLGG